MSILSDEQVKSEVIDYLVNNKDRFTTEYTELISDRDRLYKNEDVCFHSFIANEYDGILKQKIAQDIVSNLNLDQSGVIMALQDLNLKQYLGE